MPKVYKLFLYRNTVIMIDVCRNARIRTVVRPLVADYRSLYNKKIMDEHALMRMFSWFGVDIVSTDFI